MGIKPCPFCGGEAKLAGANDAVYSVVCTKCRMMIAKYKTVDGEGQNIFFTSEDEAIEAWNRRTNEN